MNYYRCRNCGELVKSDSTPRKIDTPCNIGPSHTFQDLGEIGDLIYECKHCGIRLNFNSVPRKTNDCSENDFHSWFKSSGNIRNIKFSRDDSMKKKTTIRRTHLKLIDIAKIAGFGIGIIIFGAVLLRDIAIYLFEEFPIPSVIGIVLLVVYIIYKIRKIMKG